MSAKEILYIAGCRKRGDFAVTSRRNKMPVPNEPGMVDIEQGLVRAADVIDCIYSLIS